MRAPALLTLALLLAAGCTQASSPGGDGAGASGDAATDPSSSSSGASGEDGPDAARPLWHAVYACAPPDQEEAVARNAAELSALWGRCAGGGPATAPPEVDFARHMAVAYGWGERPSSGHEVALLHAHGPFEDDGALGITVARIRPGPDCITLAVITQPGALAIVDRHEGPVDFGFLDAVHPCGE